MPREIDPRKGASERARIAALEWSDPHQCRDCGESTTSDKLPRCLCEPTKEKIR